MVKIGIVSDTHLGHVCQQLSSLKKFYRTAADLGCDLIVHAGDLTDGMGMRRGHEYETFVQGVDSLVQYVIDQYPSNIPTYFIGGNHDESTQKLAGTDILQRIAKDRTDMHYLGMHSATLGASGKTIALFHGAGMGAASNRLSRTFSEACKNGKHPDLLVNGHLHSWNMIPFVGDSDACLIQAPCFQGATNFNKRQLQTPHIGAAIVEFQSKGILVPRLYRYREVQRDY